MKTAIYLRISLDHELNKVSIDYQREQLLKLCDTKGWGAPTEYLDRNVSATKGRRKAYEDLCADIADGVISRLAVWDMDRLHRQPRELEDFIDLAQKHGVQLANVGGDVDLSTPSGQMFARMKGTVAKYEVDQKSARQKSANEKRAKNGTPWRSRTFGYNGNKIIPAEADAIRYATQAVLNGASLGSIAAEWNTAGFTTAAGAQWSGTNLRQVLMRPSNAGLQTYHIKEAQVEARKAGDLKWWAAGIIEDAEAKWPAIIERDQWEALCTLLADPKRHTGKSPGRKHLLSGIALCGKCSRPMGTTMRKTKAGVNRVVYQCKRTGCMKIVRGKDQTDKVVIDAVTRRLARPDAAIALSRPSVDTAAIRDQINTLRRQITAAEAEYDEGIIDGRRLAGRRETVLAKLAPLEAKLLGANTSRVLDGVAGHADAAQRFAALSLDRKRAVIDTLVEVTIRSQQVGGVFDPKAIAIVWK